MSRGSNSAECAAGIMWSGAETDMIGTNVSVLASDGKTGLPPLSSYSDAAKKKKAILLMLGPICARGKGEAFSAM